MDKGGHLYAGHLYACRAPWPKEEAKKQWLLHFLCSSSPFSANPRHTSLGKQPWSMEGEPSEVMRNVF